MSEEFLKQIYSWFEHFTMWTPSEKYVTSSLFSLLNMPQGCTIFDLGCGCGANTLVLAKAGATVYAMDIYEPGLELLLTYAEQEGVDERITTKCLSMDAISDITEQCGKADIVWSEGAIYNVGYENGLTLWKDLLKEKGWIVVSEACCLTDTPAEEAKAFWDANCPDIRSIYECVQIGERCGYECRGTFILPSSAWEEYCAPQRTLLEKHRALHRENKDSEFSVEFLDGVEEEIRIFDNHQDSYGYVFFLFRLL
jgi:cyclopropane fatty-acyl-phospholipid synthase-like methyltransferase